MRDVSIVKYKERPKKTLKGKSLKIIRYNLFIIRHDLEVEEDLGKLLEKPLEKI